MRIVCVEGNIGAGKSTLLPKLKELLGDEWEIIPEPADSDPEFQRLLNDFTKSNGDIKARVAFQRYITEQRSELLKNIPDGNYIIERSLYSDLVFITTGMLDNTEHFLEYVDCYQYLIEKLDDYPRIDTCIYLATSPSKSYGRMLRRGRAAEKGTPLAYLEDVSHFHDAVLPQICRKSATRLFTINGDAPTLFLAARCAELLR